MLLAYAVLALVLLPMVYLSRRQDRLPAPVSLFLDFYSAVFLPLVFNTLSPLITATRGGARDELLIAGRPGDLRRRRHGVDGAVHAAVAERPPLRLLRDLLLHRPDPRDRPVVSGPGGRAPLRLHADGRLLRLLRRLLHHPRARAPFRPGRPLHEIADGDSDLARHQRHHQPARENQARRLPVRPHDDLRGRSDRDVEAGPRRLLVDPADRVPPDRLDGVLPLPLRRGPDRRRRRSRSSSSRSGTGSTIASCARPHPCSGEARGKPRRPYSAFS